MTANEWLCVLAGALLCVQFFVIGFVFGHNSATKKVLNRIRWKESR